MAKAPKTPPTFPTEVSLCEAFLSTVDDRVWTPYAETAGWDILMSRKEDGFQIGIQAKLKLNTDVINQAIEDYHGYWSYTRAGPDCRALLVPSSNGLANICGYLSLVIITVDRKSTYEAKRGGPFRSDPGLPHKAYGDQWPEWAPAKRHPLPAYVPDVAAGASAPLQLTDWKIKAIKIAILLEVNGSVRRSDFAHLRLDHRRWIAGGWVVLKDGVYVADAMPNFKKQHPKVYKQIEADIATWRPAATAEQAALL